MKFIIIALLVAATATTDSWGRTLLPESQDWLSGFQLDESTQKSLIRMVSLGLLGGFQHQMLSNNINTEAAAETRVTLFPPQPETLPLPDLALSFPADSDLKDLIVGDVSYENVVVTGADKLVHDLTITVTQPRVSFRLSAPSITLTGAHDTALSILKSQFNISGQGGFVLKVVNLAASVDVKILFNLITSKIRITDFILELGFEDFSIDFGDTKINGQVIDWAIITTELNNNFDLYWPNINEALTKFVMEDINELIEDCKLTDVLNGNFECLIPQVPGLTTTEAPLTDAPTTEPEITYPPTTLEPITDDPHPTTPFPLDPDCPKPPVTINLNVIFNFNFNFK